MSIVNTKKVSGMPGLSAANQADYNSGKVNLHGVAERSKINMYDEHPTNTISLHEFHSIALNRLQLLRKIEFM